MSVVIEEIKKLKMKKLTSKSAQKGMRVINTSKMKGRITGCMNRYHDVLVEYDDRKGSGLYCLVKSCKERKPEYDDLFLVEG